MIKANELRIGNKIKRKSNENICTVNWGIIKDFDLHEDVSDYEPIRLTPQILEKCGFENIYLHQLQNLYFALTGNELEINL